MGRFKMCWGMGERLVTRRSTKVHEESRRSTKNHEDPRRTRRSTKDTGDPRRTRRFSISGFFVDLRVYARLIVSTLPANDVLKRRSAVGAGPFTTAPLVLYCEPWHGHVNVPD